MWLGITEYVYRNEELLNECIDTGLEDSTHVSDDLEFTFAARVRPPAFRPEGCPLMHRQDWSERVSLGHMDGYREKFEKIQAYFAPRFAEATKLGNEMIRTIEENLNSRKKPLVK